MRKYFFTVLLCLCAFETSLFADTTYDSLHNSYKYLIENTIWVVPPSTLMAYEYAAGTSTSVIDQTVWVIDSYEGGYFFGNSYTAIDDSTYSQMRLLGTITNAGEVYITFYPIGGSVVYSDLVNGIGNFKKEQGSYRFTMQMNSGSNIQGISHWSYMISVDENSPFYQNLPGVGLSVPEFLALF